MEKQGLGALAVALIKEGKDNDTVLAKIKAKFPKAKTTLASIAWYRNNLRANGVKGVKTNRELTGGTAKPPAKKKAKKAAPKKKTAKKRAPAPAAASEAKDPLA